jgi:hypothetical protein
MKAATRVAHIWAKPLSRWTLADLVAALLLISLASIGLVAVLGSVALIPAAVSGDWRRTSKARWVFPHR